MLTSFVGHEWAIIPVWEMEHGVAVEDREMNFRGEAHVTREGYIVGWSLLCMNKVKVYAPRPGSTFYEHYVRHPIRWLQDMPATDMSQLARV